MKRFKEIKDLLENVYFINEEVQLVVTFLENIGFSKPEKLVHDELGTLCEDREVMSAVDFFQECTGREIDDRYSLSTVLVMAIDDYLSQVMELKELKRLGNEESDRDCKNDCIEQYKAALLKFALMASFSPMESLKDIFESFKEYDKKSASMVMKAINNMMK